jgi:hypothetical protein
MLTVPAYPVLFVPVWLLDVWFPVLVMFPAAVSFSVLVTLLGASAGVALVAVTFML